VSQETEKSLTKSDLPSSPPAPIRGVVHSRESSGSSHGHSDKRQRKGSEPSGHLRRSSDSASSTAIGNLRTADCTSNDAGSPHVDSLSDEAEGATEDLTDLPSEPPRWSAPPASKSKPKKEVCVDRMVHAFFEYIAIGLEAKFGIVCEAEYDDPGRRSRSSQGGCQDVILTK